MCNIGNLAGDFGALDYSERTTRRPADISLSVFLFLNYLSTDREFYPLEGVFRAEYKFRFKPLHTL